MGITSQSHALTLTASVVVTAASVGMMFFAFMSSDTTIKPFLIVASISLVSVVILNVVMIIKHENDKKEQHDTLTELDPKFCPDYWTNMHDSCQGHMCKPVFEETEGTVIMSTAFSVQGTPINQVKDTNSDGVCESRNIRMYPWLEIDNACGAIERKI